MNKAVSLFILHKSFRNRDNDRHSKSHVVCFDIQRSAIGFECLAYIIQTDTEMPFSWCSHKHIKQFVVDGKSPKRSELETMLTNLKTEYKALLPERNAFLKKESGSGTVHQDGTHIP